MNERTLGHQSGELGIVNRPSIDDTVRQLLARPQNTDALIPQFLQQQFAYSNGLLKYTTSGKPPEVRTRLRFKALDTNSRAYKQLTLNSELHLASMEVLRADPFSQIGDASDGNASERFIDTLDKGYGQAVDRIADDAKSGPYAALWGYFDNSLAFLHDVEQQLQNNFPSLLRYQPKGEKYLPTDFLKESFYLNAKRLYLNLHIMNAIAQNRNRENPIRSADELADHSLARFTSILDLTTTKRKVADQVIFGEELEKRRASELADTHTIKSPETDWATALARFGETRDPKEFLASVADYDSSLLGSVTGYLHRAVKNGPWDESLAGFCGGRVKVDTPETDKVTTARFLTNHGATELFTAERLSVADIFAVSSTAVARRTIFADPVYQEGFHIAAKMLDARARQQG